jgi:NCS2 family nucleobase:cation symporter-2
MAVVLNLVLPNRPVEVHDDDEDVSQPLLVKDLEVA